MQQLDNGFERSEICEYYRGKCVLITGSTGFVGKVLLEKLVRTCVDVKTIYVIIRSKKNDTPAHRLSQLLNTKLFQKLNETSHDYRKKIIAIEGDIMKPNIGISKENEWELIENVNLIFHSAATVKFDEHLKLAVEMNVIGVKKMIDLALKMKHLEAFVHVSTAYANCDRQYISEVVYNPPVPPNRLIEAVNWMDEDLTELLTKKIIKQRPNTYTYTKAIAESLVSQYESVLPIVIVRPSIIVATWREPFPGYIDNLNGLTGILVGYGKGILRVMYGNSNAIGDIIPVDALANLLLAAAWNKGSNHGHSLNVYNFTSGQINPVTWGGVNKICLPSFRKNIPLENSIYVPSIRLTRSIIVKNLITFTEQIIPAFCLDILLKLVYKKPRFMKIQHKLKRGVQVLEYFSSNEWEFTNDNVFRLISQMNEYDKKIFNFYLKDIKWPEYFEDYCFGIKKYLLKEDLTKIKKCKTTMRK